MYNIMYFGEVIDTANSKKEALELQKQYKMAFKTNNIYIA